MVGSGQRDKAAQSWADGVHDRVHPLRALSELWILVLVARFAAVGLALASGAIPFDSADQGRWWIMAWAVILDGAIVATRWRWRQVQPLLRRQPILLPAVATLSSFTFGFGFAGLASGLGLESQLVVLMALVGSLVVTLATVAPVRVAIFGCSLGLLFGAALAFRSALALGGIGVFIPFVVVGTLLHARFDRLRQGLLDRLRVEEERAQRLLSGFERAGRGWFWETDRKGRVTYLSDKAASVLDRPAEAVLGTALVDLVSDSSEESDDHGRALGFHLAARTPFEDLEVRVPGVQNDRRWQLSGEPFYSSFGQFMGFRGFGTDLTERRRATESVTRLARFDALTGLANRAYIRQLFDQALTDEAGKARPCALMLLDLDRFKQINDTHGHPMGDALLKLVAERLRAVVGKRGEIGRLGGDEFQVVLPGMANRTALGALARDIIASLSQPYAIEGQVLVIGASVGIAVADGHETQRAETLLEQADQALYAAKDGGRGIWRSYDDGLKRNARQRRQLEDDLRHALATGGLALAFQPIINVASEQISGFEALLRWDHAERGPISPSLFLPIAREAGLMPQLGEWALRTACGEAARWHPKIRLAVNVAPEQFSDTGFATLVVNSLAQSGLEPDRLEIEVNEKVFLSAASDAPRMLEQLKALGVRLVLDDFGTGQSALGYLRDAPFDKLKIDRGFVRGASDPASPNNAIVKAIISLAEALHMETTAEGVETLDEVDLVRSLGCTHIQGHIYGKPMTAVEALNLLDNGLVATEPHSRMRSRERRFKVLRAVAVRSGGDVMPARVRNISPGGAMIEGKGALGVGNLIEVLLGVDLSARATVRWVQGDRAGVRFDEPIVLEKFHQSVPPQLPPIAKPSRRFGSAA